jgi:probable F420-dependent oxidoreductase
VSKGLAAIAKTLYVRHSSNRFGSEAMKIGAAMFFTDYSMAPDELAGELEARGFESVWAPEHSHIPLSRKTPFAMGGELPTQYYDVMDPFVTLAAAAAATKTIKIGTGVCLVVQRDTIQTAKAVASLDQISHGRFLFGIGGGWNQDEIEDHGTVYQTRFKKMREQVEAMRAIWTEATPEYHGDIVDFPPMMTRPKPVQQPSPPVIVGGAFPHAARRALRYGDGWIPHSRRPQYEDVTDYLAEFRKMAAEAGRDPAAVPVTVWGVQPDSDRMKRYAEQGVARGVVQLAPDKREATLPLLDRWAAIIRSL